MLDACEQLGIGFVPWGPLGQGYLTGKLKAEAVFDPKTDMRAGFPRFSAEVIRANEPIIALLKEVGAAKERHRRKSLWPG